MVTRIRVERPGSDSRQGQDIFFSLSLRPDRLWGQPSLLSNDCWVSIPVGNIWSYTSATSYVFMVWYFVPFCLLYPYYTLWRSHDSSVGIALGYGLDVRGFDSRRGLGIFLFTTAVSGTALGPTQPPIQCVPGALSLGVKRPGREADHSPPTSAEVKEWVELYLHSPVRFHGVVLS
jgi:hypothetical protein